MLTLRAGDEAGEAEPEESPLEQDPALTATTELPAHEPRTVDEAPTGAGETRLDELPIGDPHDGIEAVLDAGSLQNAEGIPMSDSEAAIERELAATSEWKLPGSAEPSVEPAAETTLDLTI